MNEPAYDLNMKAGEDFSFTFILHDEAGDPQDLSGCSFLAQLRKEPEAPEAYDFVCSHNNQGGHVTLTMPHAKTIRIRFLTGVYDVIRIWPDGSRSCAMRGNVQIEPAVTR